MTSDNVTQKGGHALKRIAISIRNRVFAESILFMLKQTGEFHPVRLPSVWPERILIECRSIQPEILLMDVTPALCSAMKQLIQSWRRTSCTPSKAG